MVTIGVRIAETNTLVATIAVAEPAVDLNAGFIWAITIGTDTAAPAVDEAAQPAKPSDRTT